MTSTTVNCLGMTCPQPLMECSRIISQGAPQDMRVLIADEAALENVTRFLLASGYDVRSGKQENHWVIEANLASPGVTPAKVNDYPCPVPVAAEQAGKTVVFLTSDTIGKGDDGLGEKLMGNFLKTLPELGDELWRIVMVNGAVRLTTPENPNLAALKALEDGGVTLLVCGTCLEFFGLLAKKAVGQTTNMLDVVTSLQLATKVITI